MREDSDSSTPKGTAPCGVFRRLIHGHFRGRDGRGARIGILAMDHIERGPQIDMRLRAAVIVGLVALSSGVLAQRPSGAGASFEVASVKPFTPSGARIGINMPTDRFEATGVTLHSLTAIAYGVLGAPLHDTQIGGEEPWMSTDRFTVIAKMSADVPVGASGNAQKLLMLRQLLADRFKFTVHHEMQTAQVYVLALARNDGKLGPDLRPSNLDCLAIGASGAAPPTPAGGLPDCHQMIAVRPGNAGFRSGGQTMASFSVILSRVMNRPVIDKTGLTGAFDIDIRFDTEGLEGVPTLPPSTGPRTDTQPDPVPSLFTVLQDQLGLKITPDRVPIDVIVIDHAEHPTED